MRYFHISWRRDSRADILTAGLLPAREVWPDEYLICEWESAGDDDYVWFHALESPPDTNSDVWELTRPDLYDLVEDSNFENGAWNPFFRTGRVSPEHLIRISRETT